jgi:hypothetical protein
MKSDVLQKLAKKSLSKEQLFTMAKENHDLIPVLITGLSSEKPAIRYGCGKVLMDLSEEEPERLYKYMDVFCNLLESRYRILTWNAIIIIANLAKVDRAKKFDAFLNKYFQLLQNEYMVTVANVVGNAGKIALAKPYLTKQIVNQLLTVENISPSPHLSQECKRVIMEHAIQTFDLIYPQIEQKERVISFVKKHLKSPRKTLQVKSAAFLNKWASST